MGGNKKKGKKTATAKGEKKNNDEFDFDDLKISTSCYDQLNVQPLKEQFEPWVQEEDKENKDMLCAAVNSNQGSFSFFISKKEGDVVGRRAIANRNLPAGFTILKENGFPHSICNTHNNYVCHQCHSEVVSHQVAGTSCEDCHQVTYCNMECQEMHSSTHAAECKALSKLQAIAMSSEVDVDLVRMAIAYIGRTITVKAEQSKKKASSLNFTSTRQDVEGLVSHRESMSEDQITKPKKAAMELLKVFGDSTDVTQDNIIDFLFSVNSNSHGLSLPNQAQYGLGLFPLCSIFNHSCYPNCLYVNEGKQLVFRCTRAIKKGEELSVNYVSLYQSRDQRRKELMVSKKFLCNCTR